MIDLPTAVKENLIKNALDNPLDFLNSELVKRMKNNEFKKSNYINLFDYQAKAFELWKKNDMIILLEMATGTGKTRTAIACIKHFISFKKKPVVIVACPQGTLSRQWKKEIESLYIQVDKAIIIDGTNNKWASELSTSLLEVKIGRVKSLVIYTTHITACKVKFVNEITKWDEVLDYLLVGDEVHGMGASETKKSLLSVYKSRLGLSATPQRWFDEEGTKIIEDYFNNSKFEFNIYDALTNINPLTGKSFLVNYYYLPIFISLIDEEVEKYMLLSNRISKLSNMNAKSDDYSATLEKLIFDRANIQKNAYNKYNKLSEILDSIKSIKDMIIFVSPEQIEEVMLILRDKNIIAHQFTQCEGTSPETKYCGLSERQYLIENFKNGTYQVLVAIKCLDEGIDIPSASCAILMASSSNPREYVQRIGRVIRRYEGKDRAYIYDLVIKPSYDRFNNPLIIEFEKKIYNKELTRCMDIATNSINNAEAISIISKNGGA